MFDTESRGKLIREILVTTLPPISRERKLGANCDRDCTHFIILPAKCKVDDKPVVPRKPCKFKFTHEETLKIPK